MPAAVGHDGVPGHVRNGAPSAKRTRGPLLWWVYTVFAVTAAFVAARAVASVVAVPLDTDKGASAASFELTSASNRPVTAILYGREVGVHFVRIPATDGAHSKERFVPERLRVGEVHVMPLSLRAMHLEAKNLKGGASAYSITAPAITWNKDGVRMGW